MHEQHTAFEDTDLEEPDTCTHVDNTEPQREELERLILTNALDSNLAKWTDTYPNLRPAIPKLQYSKRAYEMIKSINSIITAYIQTNTTLEQIHCLIYCAALTVTQLHN